MSYAFCQLSAITDLLAGNTFRGSLQDEPQGEVSVLAMSLAEADTVTEEMNLPQIAFEGDAGKFQLEPGDILFRSRGVNNLSIYVESARKPCIFATPLVRIRVHDPLRLEPRYLHWVLNSSAIQRDIHAVARGTMIRMVSLQALRGIAIPVPPIVVQRKIAEVARLQREEQTLSAKLNEKTQLYAEQVLWAAAQAVNTPA